MYKEYLGDGVYVELDEMGQARLFCQDMTGIEVQIFLEPEVMKNLESWWNRTQKKQLGIL